MGLADGMAWEREHGAPDRPIVAEQQGGRWEKLVFPITLSCDDRGWSEYRYREFFLANKPKGLTWFAYDTIILSETEVEFVVYDMRCNYSGGRGVEIERFKAAVPKEIIGSDIEKKIVAVAAARRGEELAAHEKRIIAGYADEIRAAMNHPTAAPPHLNQAQHHPARHQRAGAPPQKETI